MMTPETRKEIEEFLARGGNPSPNLAPDTWLRECLNELERLRNKPTYRIRQELQEKVDQLQEALRNLIQASDHVGSNIYDWQKLLPRFIEEGRAALKERGENDAG